MAGWHHRLDGHEFEQVLGGGDGQGGLECCSPQGHKELDMTEGQNNKNVHLHTRAHTRMLLLYFSNVCLENPD